MYLHMCRHSTNGCGNNRTDTIQWVIWPVMRTPMMTHYQPIPETRGSGICAVIAPVTAHSARSIERGPSTHTNRSEIVRWDGLGWEGWSITSLLCAHYV